MTTSAGTSPTDLPEPPKSLSDPAGLLPAYLDYYRSVVLRKIDGLSDAELRTSRLPSGWTPLELLQHLAYVELRWLRWGFAGETISEPWGDRGADDRWQVAPGQTAAQVRDFFARQCERSRAIAAAAQLTDRAQPGPRFDGELPALSWILFHVLQEYARHAGQLDIARELADGGTGE
jgi:uncharacterized damage-inducible protein DinB